MWKTIGHDRSVSSLTRAVELNRISHAYMITGPAQIGKMTLALDLAASLNCEEFDRPCWECLQCARLSKGIHTDVRVLKSDHDSKEGGTRDAVGINLVREVRKDSSLKSFQGTFKVFIFESADRLTAEAANALLKLLEEPPEHVVIILLATDRGAIPLTIVSRCQVLELRPVPLPTLIKVLTSEHGLENKMATEIARLSGGRLGWAIEIVETPELLQERSERLQTIANMLHSELDSRFAYASALSSEFSRNPHAVQDEFHLWIDWWRDLLLIKYVNTSYLTNLSLLDLLNMHSASVTTAQIVDFIRIVQMTWSYIQRNVNPRMSIEQMMLALPSRLQLMDN